MLKNLESEKLKLRKKIKQFTKFSLIRTLYVKDKVTY